MNIVVEGIDRAGKNTLAKEIAVELKMQYFNDEFNRCSIVNSASDAYLYYNAKAEVEFQMLMSLDNIVKSRAWITHTAYSSFYKRSIKTNLTLSYLNSLNLNKNILTIFKGCTYGQYVNRCLNSNEDVKYSLNDFKYLQETIYNYFLKDNVSKHKLYVEYDKDNTATIIHINKILKEYD